MPTDKNSYFGDFDRFQTLAPHPDSPEFMSFITRKRGEEVWVPRAEVIASLSGGWELVRHGLDWRDLEPVYEAVNSQGDPVARNQQHNTAVYSLRSALGVAFCMRACLRSRGVEICDIAVPIEQPANSQNVLEALAELDFDPGSWASWLASSFDCWHEDGQWQIRKPLVAVSVSMERICFDYVPALKEVVDVLVPFESELPLDGGGDRLQDAVAAYGSRAFGRGDILPGLRPGFGSWMSKGATLVKLVGPHGAAEYEAMTAAMSDQREEPKSA